MQTYLCFGLVALATGCNLILGVEQFSEQDAMPAVPDAFRCIESECGPYAVCLGEDAPACECVAGYTMGAAGCEWTGVVADPSFQTTTTWSLAGAGQVFPTSAALTDPGLVTLTPCGTGSVSQVVTMPRRSRSQPLVIAATYGQGSFPLTSADIRLGNTWYPLSWRDYTTDGWLTKRRCLGENEYAPESTTGTGAPLTLEVIGGASCPSQTLTFDHLSIEVAEPGECPDPGTVLNGDQEAQGGWVVDQLPGVSSAQIFAGIGANGSSGFRIVAQHACDRVIAHTRISVPAQGSPKLSIYRATKFLGSTNAPSMLDFRVDSDALLIPTGSGAPGVEHFCLPSYVRGSVVDLSATVTGGFGSACTNSVASEAVLDDLVLSDDPACGTDPVIADASFESGTTPAGTGNRRGTAEVVYVADATAPHGARVARLSSTDGCGVYLARHVVTPAAVGSNGPAVRFHYKLDPSNVLVFRAAAALTTMPSQADGAWHEETLCLYAPRAGHPSNIAFSLTAGNCNTTTLSTVWIDNLVVTTDAACAP